MSSRRSTDSTGRRRADLAAGWHKRLSGACGRHIRFETLEDRCLLSAATVHTPVVAPPSLAATIASASLAATSDSSTGPTIGHVVISQATERITWNVSNDTPVATSTILIDGVTVSGVAGPFTSSSGGVNFSAPIDSLAIGLHSYIINATDTAGNTSTITNTFTITEAAVTATSTPVISSVVVSQSSGRVSWNVVDSTTIAFSTLSIDGTSLPFILGPYTASSGVNFSGPLTILAAGQHSLTITATDAANVTGSLTQEFTIAPTSPGPVISTVVVTGSTDTITWTATDASGVASSTLKIDGISIVPTGPVGTPTTANYSASLGLLNAGLHTISITATNTLNVPSTLNANFVLDSQTSVGPTISLVTVSESRARISWNALDSKGVTGSTLSIDGNPVSSIAGPFTAVSGVNFSAPLDSLLAGMHSYSIAAFDGIGSTGTVVGTFTLAATTTYDPMISLVTIAQARGRISWNVFSPNTIANSTLQVDGVVVRGVVGPFTAASGVNFSAPLAGLTAGNHTYRITATDTLGRRSTALANFNLTVAIPAATSATRSAVFSGMSNSALTSSAKADWVFDLGGLTDNA
jgi:large repetitive protein